MSALATIGHNNPPPPTPYEQAEKEITDLYGEATLWLDGAVVDNQDLADGLGNLLNLIRAAEKKADTARKEEKQPHMDAAKAVDDKYRPLIEQAKRATDGCKAALAPWLAKVEAEKRAREEAARREAEEKARLAREALQSADVFNLAEREHAESLVKAAKKAEAKAKAAAKDGAKAGGAIGRVATLRTTYTPVLTDAREAIRHYWLANNAEIIELLRELAAKDVRAGKREIPGFRIEEQTTVV